MFDLNPLDGSILISVRGLARVKWLPALKVNILFPSIKKVAGDEN